MVELNTKIIGRCQIIDTETKEVLRDEYNAIHPQNMSRIIARALSRESNSWIHRIAFGNGGTVVNAAQQITYKTPNDGLDPDTSEWYSRLYNETYSEIIDDQNVSLGSGPGAVPDQDPTSVPNVSGPGVRSYDNGLTSTVRVECVLNPNEPSGQDATDSTETNTESEFMFDEIGLFTSGAPLVATAGYVEVEFATARDSTQPTGLLPNTSYYFHVVVDGGAMQRIVVSTPAVGSGTGGVITYGDLCAIIGSSGMTGCLASVTGYPNSSTQTYGMIRFTSATTGTTSSVALPKPGSPGATPPAGMTTAKWLFTNLTSYTDIGTPIAGASDGVLNNPSNPETEAARMLTHVIFTPVQKSANRSLTIVYTLPIAVARSAH